MPPSAFLIRDVIQHVIPTLVALVLFVPLVTDDVGGGPLVMGAVVLAVVAGALMSTIGGPVVRMLPGLAGRARRHRRNRAWWNRNFDFVRLWYRLTQAERQNLYATQAYAEMYAMVAFYLLAYVVTNAVVCFLGFAMPAVEDGAAFDMEMVQTIAAALWEMEMPMFGDWRAPSIALIVIGLCMFVFAAAGHVREIDLLFGDDGQYVSLARIHHLETGDIATGLWGRVTRGGRPLANASITIMDVNDEKLGWSETDRNGRFQAPHLFADSFLPGQEAGARTFRLEISADDEDKLCVIPLTRRQIPELNISLT